jgi:hypothetical protein
MDMALMRPAGAIASGQSLNISSLSQASDFIAVYRVARYLTKEEAAKKAASLEYSWDIYQQGKKEHALLCMGKHNTCTKMMGAMGWEKRSAFCTDVGNG